MSDETPQGQPAETTDAVNELLDLARDILSDETASEGCKEIARELMRRLTIANS